MRTWAPVSSTHIKKLGMAVGSCNPSSEEAENISGFGEKDWAATEEYTQF